MLTKYDNVRKELQDIAHTARNVIINDLTSEEFSSFKAGFVGSIRLQDYSLARVGLKGISDDAWKLSFGDRRITKRAVSQLQLSKVLRSPDAVWDVPPIEGVVTAIYSVSGGRIFTGDAKAVAIDGVDLQATSVPVVISEAWHCTVTETGDIIVAEDYQDEWIIAIEYLKLKTAKPDNWNGFTDSQGPDSDSPNVRRAWRSGARCGNGYPPTALPSTSEKNVCH
jgi:hypothetical protein